MSEAQSLPRIMSPDMLEEKIKLCEDAYREYQRKREERKKQSASSLGASALRRTIRAEETLDDNPNIVLGFD